jgi:hypothetical protein
MENPRPLASALDKMENLRPSAHIKFEELDEFEGYDEFEGHDVFEGYDEDFVEPSSSSGSDLDEEDETVEQKLVGFHIFRRRDVYPLAHLVSLKVNAGKRSEADDAKYDSLYEKQKADYAFKMSMHKDEDLQRIYLEIYKGKKEATEFEKEESTMKKLESIENGLVNRIDFAVSQRRFVTELHVAGALVKSAKVWKKATMELTIVADIASKWNTKRMKSFSSALEVERQSDIADSGFKRDLRSVWK